MDAVLDWMTSVASAPWLYPVVLVLVVADAFTVVVPSETVVVALASLSFSTGQPALWLLLPTATVGAIIGDNLCFAIGRRLGTTRFAWMRRPKVAAAIAYAAGALERRPAAVILTARYIPFARIATNLTAGATGFPYRRYLPLTVIAGAGWALYNSVIGALFGVWLAENPVLAIVVSVAVAITLGVTIDAVTARWSARAVTRTRPGSEESEPGRTT
ncbi:VTT domain-containing protein [Antiquaquibacter oligotrophicus]|nr:VTT domain-containing protein [Antiquaquibacter oligotrophicus]UDF13603.1 VTT domain-containing protein [Antiquaquibacter oligotrophicus]